MAGLFLLLTFLFELNNATSVLKYFNILCPDVHLINQTKKNNINTNKYSIAFFCCILWFYVQSYDIQFFLLLLSFSTAIALPFFRRIFYFVFYKIQIKNKQKTFVHMEMGEKENVFLKG